MLRRLFRIERSKTLNRAINPQKMKNFKMEKSLFSRNLGRVDVKKQELLSGFLSVAAKLWCVQFFGVFSHVPFPSPGSV